MAPCDCVVRVFACISPAARKTTGRIMSVHTTTIAALRAARLEQAADATAKTIIEFVKIACEKRMCMRYRPRDVMRQPFAISKGEAFFAVHLDRLLMDCQ